MGYGDSPDTLELNGRAPNPDRGKKKPENILQNVAPQLSYERLMRISFQEERKKEVQGEGVP